MVESLTGLAAKAGTVVVTSLRNERWSLVQIAEGRSTTLVSDRAVKHSPRFGDSDDELYFVADYGNVDNVWSWRGGDRELRSEEHTSELQSLTNLVCRLLLEKKKLIP